MADSIIKAQVREQLGTSATKKIRGMGLVPVVMYGNHYDSVNLAIDAGAITKYINAHGSGAKLTISVDGKEEMAIIKSLQRDVIKRHIMHVELQHLSAGEAIKMALPIHFIGEDKLVKNTVLQKTAHEIDIEALPKDLIDYITIDVSQMNIGDVLTLADIDSSNYAGITFTGEPDTTIVSLMEAQLYVEESAEEGEEADAPAEATASEE